MPTKYQLLKSSCPVGLAWSVGLSAAAGGTYYSSVPSGEWSNSTTWGGSGVPGAGDQAVITTGHAVEVSASDVVVASLEVRLGTALQIAPGRRLIIGHAGAASSHIAADLNGDGRINGGDLAIVLGQWTGAATYSRCPPFSPTDLNHDCAINGADLAMLLAAWNP